MVVDVKVNSARTNSNVPVVGGPLPLLGSLALGAQQSKLDSDIHTSSSLGTPSILIVHDYNPFAFEDGDRPAPMAAELVDRLAIWAEVRRFPLSKLGFGGLLFFEV
jgi:hypothetical protein